VQGKLLKSKLEIHGASLAPEKCGGLMRKSLLTIFALLVALGIATPTVMADHDDHGHGKGHKHGKHSDDDERWERRDGYERPPGWNRGKKTGWGNCGLPPGQAKKYGCRTYMYEGRPHYYYQDDAGQVIVRRPIIEVHANVDIVR
jgi:hypothetical protein